MAVVERVLHCAACHLQGVDRELDLVTPRTRDGIFHLTSPTHESRNIPLCGPHADAAIPGASVWECSQMGEHRAGGTMVGTARFPYHVD